MFRVLPQLYQVASAGGTVMHCSGDVLGQLRPVVDPSDMVVHPVETGVAWHQAVMA